MPWRVLASNEFKRRSKKLSSDLQGALVEKGAVFERDPFHPSLRTHKLDGPLGDIWAFSIDRRHRVIFEFLSHDEILLLSVGDHSMYRKKRA